MTGMTSIQNIPVVLLRQPVLPIANAARVSASNKACLQRFEKKSGTYSNRDSYPEASQRGVDEKLSIHLEEFAG
jgi:hypothetical protein